MAELGAQPLAIPCSTTFDIPGATVERSLGLCFGLVVRSVGHRQGLHRRRAVAQGR